MSQSQPDVGVFMCGAISGAVLTSFIFAIAIAYHTVPMSDVIKHKAAYYHPETGTFTWRHEENPHAEPE